MRCNTFLTLLALAFSFVTDASAEAGRLGMGSQVRVQIEDGHITPSKVSLQPGMTVVWVNKSPNPVRVRFTSHAVSTTCEAPQNFIVDHRGIYVSGEIGAGKIASLCFLERDSYPYEIEVEPDPTQLSPAETIPTDTTATATPEPIAGQVFVE